MIILKQAFEELADVLLRGRGQEYAPTLFLGSGVAKAARVPTIKDMARDMYPILASKDDPSARPAGAGDEEAQLDTFYAYWARLSPTERRILLRRTYSEVAVPTFYQDIARLLVHRYFASVLTTSIDTLLEQALAANGLRTGSDYVVVNLAERPKSAPDMYGSLVGPALHILKLHGDLAQQDVAITPEEVDRILMPQRGLVKGELSRDMVLVGYGFESEPINNWLTWTPGRLWWVSAERPSPDEIGRIEAVHQVEYIDGDNGDPTQFFGLLNIRLAQTPTQMESSSRGLKGVSDTEDTDFSVQPLSGDLEPELLRQRLAEKKSILRKLEQEAAYQGPNPQLQAQTDYERRQIAEIENQLRIAVYGPEQIIATVNAVARSARHSGADPGSVSFLRRQANTNRDEFKRTPPNQDVIGAATGAVMDLASRLGPEVVDSNLLAQLAAIAPSSAGSMR